MGEALPATAQPPRNEAAPIGAASVPVSEALRLIDSLQDLPVEVRSAVLLRVFGQPPGPHTGAHE